MDWADPSAATALWVFPKGMKRDGTAGDNPIKWSAKYGSSIVSFYDAGTADGMNEKGQNANMLYLKEAKWGCNQGRKAYTDRWCLGTVFSR